MENGFIVASNGLIHEDLLKIIQEHFSDLKKIINFSDRYAE